MSPAHGFQSEMGKRSLIHHSICALENPGDTPLELIEVQVGSYLGEDDIVRFKDNYGRVIG